MPPYQIRSAQWRSCSALSFETQRNLQDFGSGEDQPIKGVSMLPVPQAGPEADFGGAVHVGPRNRGLSLVRG